MHNAVVLIRTRNGGGAGAHCRQVKPLRCVPGRHCSSEAAARGSAKWACSGRGQCRRRTCTTPNPLLWGRVERALLLASVLSAVGKHRCRHAATGRDVAQRRRSAHHPAAQKSARLVSMMGTTMLAACFLLPAARSLRRDRRSCPCAHHRCPLSCCGLSRPGKTQVLCSAVPPACSSLRERQILTAGRTVYRLERLSLAHTFHPSSIEAGSIAQTRRASAAGDRAKARAL